MRIHITTIAPESAAVEIMEHMQARGGEWIVNAVEDEGYVMARVGTLDGKRLERSLSPCLVGPFSSAWSLACVESDLKLSRAIGYGLKSSMAGRSVPISRGGAWMVTGYKPRGDEVTIVEQLKREQLPVTELASRLNLPRKRVADLLRKLRTRKCVEVVRVEQIDGINVMQHVYGVAA